MSAPDAATRGENETFSPLALAALEVVEDQRACLRRLDGGWRVDLVLNRNGCWARWDGAEDVKAVVTEPMSQGERIVMKWLRRPLVAAPVGRSPKDARSVVGADPLDDGAVGDPPPPSPSSCPTSAEVESG